MTPFKGYGSCYFYLFYANMGNVKFRNIEENDGMSTRHKNIVWVFLAMVVSVNAQELSVRMTTTHLPGIGRGEDLKGDTRMLRRDPSDVIKVEGVYHVWYTKGYNGYNATVWHASSKDGLTWKEQGEVIQRGPGATWDSNSAFTPNILVAEGKYWLFYTGVAKEFRNDGPYISRTAIGLAVADSVEGPWKKVSQKPILSSSTDPADFDSLRIDDSAVVVRDGKYYLYYKGRQWNNTPSHTKMGLAIAERPEGPYVKYEGNPVIDGGHEVVVWPYKEGVISMMSIGPEGIRKTLQYAPDGIHFTKMMSLDAVPLAAGVYREDHFRNNYPGEMITWGVQIGRAKGSLAFIERFDFEWSEKQANAPLYVYANVYYPLTHKVVMSRREPLPQNYAISSEEMLILPEALKEAGVKVTDQSSMLIEDFSNGLDAWYQLNETNPDAWQLITRKIKAQKWRGPGDAKLCIDVKSSQPNSLVFRFSHNKWGPYPVIGRNMALPHRVEYLLQRGSRG